MGSLVLLGATLVEHYMPADNDATTVQQHAVSLGAALVGNQDVSLSHGV
jgi:hypothetical protein